MASRHLAYRLARIVNRLRATGRYIFDRFLWRHPLVRPSPRLTLAALTVLTLVSALPAALALLLVWQGTYMLVIVNGITCASRSSPYHRQGRVNVTARMIAWGGTPFGAALGGLVAQLAGIRVAYLVMAAGVAASTAIGWASPTLRHKASFMAGG